MHAVHAHAAVDADDVDVDAMPNAVVGGEGFFTAGASINLSVWPDFKWGGTVSWSVVPLTTTLNFDLGAAPAGIWTEHVAAAATCSGMRKLITSPPRFPGGT